MGSISFEGLSHDYQRIERAIKFLQTSYRRQPDLSAVARSAHLSEYHFQRLFTRWVGISPKRFLQYLTVEHAKGVLRESRSVLDATFEAGLSSPGRLHDLFVTVEAMTPGEFKNNGEGLTIEYGIHPTPFGECLLGVTDRGICALFFVQQNDRKEVVRELRRRWPGASLVEAPGRTRPYVEKIFRTPPSPHQAPLPLVLRGTNFQIRVWEALLRIPPGRVLSYEDIAQRIGQPKASRAVGNAVAKNPISYIIPCHRVIQSIGITGNYRWGPARKKAILGWEWAEASSETASSAG
jgi:AraC family transcriptional regulator of adaptative response/methylated-DNA-[protein]-cysteine methyltransferase